MVSDKFQKNVIWLIWEGLLSETANQKNDIYKKIIQSLLDLFCIKYTFSSNKQKKYLIYCAISFITEEVNFNIPLATNNDLIKGVTNNIGIIYKQIKKNEVSPNTDYLFIDTPTSNIEKSLKKIETMNILLEKSS